MAARTVLNANIERGLLPTSPDQIVSRQAFDAETRALTPKFSITRRPGAGSRAA